MRASLATLIALITLAWTLPGWAQHEGWYQIEIIVFERPPANTSEIWPKDITLDYPIHWQQLRDIPEETSTETESGETDWTQAAFYRLPAEDRALDNAAGHLRAKKGFRVLFHESWRQPVAGRESTPSLLIEGGRSYGDHRELEGSVNVNVARYLHLETNLWLTDFQPNAGQSRNQWPELPQNPVDRLEAIEASAGDFDNSFGGGSLDSAVNAWQSMQLTESGTDSGLPEFLSAPYLPERIVTFKQKRRMRSGELHYIDHPLMGLLIKIVPFEKPEGSSSSSSSSSSAGG